MAAHKFRVLVSVLAVALMLGTCFLPTINTGDESEAAAIDVAAASGSTEEKESYNIEDILSYLSKLDLQELITSLGLPDFDIPFELLPNMTMEEFFTALKQIMSGEKTLREVLEEAGVSYSEQIAAYMRDMMESVLDKAGQAFTDIIKNSMSSTEPKLYKVISSPTTCYKGQEYKMTGGSEFTFKDTGKLIFVDGSKLTIDGNFKLICDMSLTSGTQIELKQGSVINICGYEHTIMSDISIEMRGTVESVFSVDFAMGSINRADFVMSIGIGDSGYVKFSRMNTFFQFDSCRNDENEFSIMLHAEVTDTLLNAMNIGDTEAAMKDLSNTKNKISAEIKMFDTVGITDLVSELDISLDYAGQGSNTDKNALEAFIGLELSEDEVVLFDAEVDANFTQADIMSEVEAFSNNTSKMLPFKGTIELIMDLGQRTILNEYGIDVCTMDLSATYDMSVNDSSDMRLDIDFQHASFEIGIASFVLEKDADDNLPRIVSVEMPLLKMKLTTDNYRVTYPISLFEDNDVSVLEAIVAGSEVDGILYVGERDDPDINWHFEKYEDSDYRMEFDGTVDVPEKSLKVLMLNTNMGEPKFRIDIDNLVMETVDGEQRQSGTADMEVFLALESADVDKETKINTLVIDADCTVDLEKLTGDGYIRVDGKFGAVNEVMGAGIFENSGAMELILSANFNELDVEFDGSDGYTVDGNVTTLIDFHSSEGDEEVNIFRHVMKYTTEKEQQRSLRSSDFKGAYTLYKEIWALEDTDVPSVSDTIKGTVGYSLEQSVTEKDVSSIESYYLDRLFKVGYNQEGQVEASVRDGNEPLKVVIENGVKSVTGIADISLVYGSPETDVSIGRMNVDIGFSETFENSVLEAIQRMGFKISALEIHDAVDDNTYMKIDIPEFLVEMTDAVSSPVYEIIGSASSDIQLNKIHVKSSVDIPNGIYSKSRPVKTEEGYTLVSDVTGEATVSADVEITGGTSGEDGYYHVAIDGLRAKLVLDGTLYTSSKAEMLGLLSAGSLIECNSFIYITQFQETTDILAEDLYLKYSEEGNCLVVELGNSSNKASNRLKVTTSNFKIADKKVKYLEFEANDNYSKVYVTQEDLANMYAEGNIKLNGFSVGTEVSVKDISVGMSMGNGDNIRIGLSDIDLHYLTDDEIRFGITTIVSGNDFTLDYEGNDGTTYVTLTKLESKAYLGSTLDISEIETIGAKLQNAEFRLGSTGLSKENYGTDAGATVDINVTTDSHMFNVVSGGMKVKVDANGYFSNLKSIAMWDADMDVEAKDLNIGLLVNENRLSFDGRDLKTCITNDPKAFKTDATFSSSHAKVDYRFANMEYSDDLTQMILELTNSYGDAQMIEYDVEDISLNVKSDYITLVLTDLAEAYGTNIDMRTKGTLKEYELAGGQYTFATANMVLPITVSGDSKVTFENGTNRFATIMFDNPANVSGSFYIGGDVQKKYIESYVLKGGEGINLNISNDYIVYVKDLKNKDIEVLPLKGHSVAEHKNGVSYTISDEGNAVLTSFKGTVDINSTLNKYKLTIDGVDKGEVEYSSTKVITRDMGATKEGYVFVGWNDGYKTYPATARLEYEMPARDVQMTTVWAKSIQYRDRNSCTDETSITFDAYTFSNKLKDDSEQISIAMKDLTVGMDKTFLSEISPDDDNIIISANVVTELEDDVKERVGDGICIDITVSNGSEVSEFDGGFYITVAIPSDWDSRTVRAYCIDTTHNEQMEVTNVFTDDGVQYVTFALTHFSQYVVDNCGTFTETNDSGEGNNDSGSGGSSSEGGNMMLYIGIGAAALVVLLGVVIFLVKKH